MNLSPEDIALFYRLYRPLLAYVSIQLNLIWKTFWAGIRRSW